MFSIPLQMMLVALAGRLNEEQRVRIEFLQEQVRVLLELHGDKQLRYAESLFRESKQFAEIAEADRRPEPEQFVSGESQLPSLPSLAENVRVIGRLACWRRGRADHTRHTRVVNHP